MNWQLSKIQYPIYNLGAGRRLGIWVQGCDLGCAGCVNQLLWGRTGGKGVDVLALFNWLAAHACEFRGVTISGGEPFQQYEPLMTFLHLVKKKTALDVYCFSGYYLNELEAMFPDKLFFRYLDFLVDGRYVQALHDDGNVKGSSNQTVYRFIDGRAVRQEEIPSNKWSVQVDRDNQIYMAGVPKKDDLKRLSSQLAKAGIRKEFK